MTLPPPKYYKFFSKNNTFRNTFRIYFNQDFYITLWLKPTTIDTSYPVSAVVGFWGIQIITSESSLLNVDDWLWAPDSGSSMFLSLYSRPASLCPNTKGGSRFHVFMVMIKFIQWSQNPQTLPLELDIYLQNGWLSCHGNTSNLGAVNWHISPGNHLWKSKFLLSRNWFLSALFTRSRYYGQRC